MKDAPSEYLARCHCGAIRARYRTVLAPSSWTIRACQCSFCRAHGALSVSDPAGQVMFEVGNKDALQRYRFGARTAEFLICRVCGVYVGARLVEAGLGILNARALRPVPALPEPAAMDYEQETAADRTARRAARWTPLGPASV